MKEFYQNLQKKRSEKGISLEDINQKTRLPMSYLKALEEGRMDDLPFGYERIYLRRYVKEIGLNEAEVLRDFDMLTGRLAPTTASDAVSEEAELEEPVAAPSPSFPSSVNAQEFVHSLNLDRIHKLVWVGGAFFAILLAGYFIWQQYMTHQNDKALEVKEISLQELVENFEEKDTTEVIPDSTEVQAATALIASQGTTGNVNVLLNALKRTWIREIRDVKDTTDYILPRGIRRSVNARSSIQFRFGVADGVEVWLNKKNLGVMGKEDEVLLYLLLDADGIQGKRVRKVQPGAKAPVSTAIPDAPPIRGQ
ncbi:MAG: helix-turn-helix domain-containing protein [Calditrichia bacterium]